MQTDLASTCGPEEAEPLLHRQLNYAEIIQTQPHSSMQHDKYFLVRVTGIYASVKSLVIGHIVSFSEAAQGKDMCTIGSSPGPQLISNEQMK